MEGKAGRQEGWKKEWKDGWIMVIITVSKDGNYLGNHGNRHGNHCNHHGNYGNHHCTVIMVIIIVTIVGGMPRIKRDNLTT